jgi:hypothetical protein
MEATVISALAATLGPHGLECQSDRRDTNAPDVRKRQNPSAESHWSTASVQRLLPYMPRAARCGRHRAVREGRYLWALTGTARIATYVFPGAAKGEFTLNGGAALHVRLYDQVAVLAYGHEETFCGASCVIVDPSDNSIMETLQYETPSEVSTIAGGDGRRHPSPIELEGARYQGRHVAEIAARLSVHKN